MTRDVILTLSLLLVAGLLARLLATLVDQGVICVRADGRFVAASRM